MPSNKMGGEAVSINTRRRRSSNTVAIPSLALAAMQFDSAANSSDQHPAQTRQRLHVHTAFRCNDLLILMRISFTLASGGLLFLFWESPCNLALLAVPLTHGNVSKTTRELVRPPAYGGVGALACIRSEFFDLYAIRLIGALL
jgi:hypothetical protein